MSEGTDWIVFEQPLAERVRNYLRLEFLFHQYAHHRSERSLWGYRAALQTLLDVFTVLGRSDLKNELIKDLAEQQGHLARLSDRPQVDAQRLDAVLAELAAASRELLAAPLHPTTALRDSDLLHAVMNRVVIPGGTCTFDLPAYHRWLCRPYEQVERDLDRWQAQIAPLQRGIQLLLLLLRQSTPVREESTESGVFLYQPQQAYQLVRVMLPSALDVYPEISASRHRFSIRFMRLGDVDQRNVQVTERVDFRLQCCALTPS